MRQIHLAADSQSIYHAIQLSTPAFRDGNLPAVIVTGLEATQHLEALVKGLNQIREEFRKNCLFPIVIWINDDVMKRMIRAAPDFESWTTTIEFAIDSDNLIKSLTSGTESLFHLALNANLIDPSHSLGRLSHLGGIYLAELDVALRDLVRHGGQIPPSLQAGLDFIRGMNTRDFAQSLSYLRSSYRYWQSIQNIERQGLLLYQIGRRRFHLTKIEKHSHAENWHEVEQLFSQSLACFESADRHDLMSQCYLQLQRTLYHLQSWTELKELSQQAIVVHQSQHDFSYLVSDYGFLAKVALEEQSWQTAKEYAEQAIALLADVPNTLHWLYGLYFCYLAESQIQLGDRPEAMTNLRAAKSRDHCGHSRMYIQILNQLRDLYFDQGQYLEAFKIKKERLAIEQRYGYRAFIGAAQLQSCLEEQSSFVDKSSKLIISPEIYASGRKRDLDELIKRIGEPRYKMIVLYGNSGVGKSSFINAGMLPALQQTSFGGKDIIPISIRVYTSWEQELINLLQDALQGLQLISAPLFDFIYDQSLTKEMLGDRLREQLHWNEAHNFQSVLIFDQFEEFFFVHQHHKSDRLRFFEFLGSLLSDFQYLSSIKVVLSLREDYIHYLLECNQAEGMSAIDNDILSKNVLYSLGNFSAAAAHSTIEALTERAQFYLEPQLIAVLVEDLKNEQGEIRPIELQIVGAQLQQDRISTIQQYQALGSNPKEWLVQRYLDNVVADCGKENHRLAYLLLYLLTDEKGTRPLKTYLDLEREVNNLGKEVSNGVSNPASIRLSKIEPVLKILIDSGLIVLIPENSTNLYQLVHDYLAVVIRKSQAPEIQKLQKELEKTQGELRQTVHKLEGLFKNSQAIADSLALNSLINNNLIDLDELTKAIRIAKYWQTDIEAIASENRLRLSSTIYRAIYEIKEKDRIQAHLEGVWSAEFSPDGSQIVTGGLDNIIKLWTRDGQEIRQIIGHTAAIRSASFSPDGQMILSSSSDKTISLWNLQGDRLSTLIGHTATVWSTEFSGNGEMIVSGSGDQTIKLWTRNGAELLTLTGHKGDVRTVLFSPNGEWIISGGADKNIMIWDLDGRLLHTLKGHTADIRCIAISANGGFIASGSGDNILKLWKIEKEQDQTAINEVFSITAHTSAIRSVSFSPDSNMLATGSADKNIKIWNLRGKEQQFFKGHTDPIRSVSFSPDGQTLLSASLDCTVRQWQIENRAQQILLGHGAAVKTIAFSPDGLRLASGGLDDQIKIWDLQGNQLQNIVSDNDILSVSFSPDGHSLLVGSGDRAISLFALNGNSHKLVQTFTGHSTAVWAIDFSFDGKKIVSGSGDKSVKLWWIDGSEIATLQGHKSTVWAVRFSPDGQKIISASGDDTIKLWHIDGTELQTLIGHRAAVWSVCFSPDGQNILSGSGDSTLKLWNLEGKLLQTFRGHDAGVWAVSFSPDGRTIISGSSDNTIRLWSIDGKELQTLPCPDNAPLSLCFHPNGLGFASGHGSNTIGLWNFDLSALITQGDAWLDNHRDR
jgi:WD40 repeat protein